MTRVPKDGPINASDATGQGLGDALARLDDAHADGLARAQLLQDVRARAAVRERDRLAAKYGSDTHPRVAAVEARVAVEARLATTIAGQAELARTPAPATGIDSWAVQGRVLRSSGAPAARMTISLADEGGVWDQTAGRACTDAQGAFQLQLRPAPAPARPLRLTVTDDAGKTLFRDPSPLTPTAGVVDARTVVLDGAECAPPPAPVGRPSPETS